MTIRIYLAGSKGPWRDNFKALFPKIDFIVPFKDSKQDALIYFVSEDLEAIKKSDMMIIYINYPIYTGVCVEAGYAFALGKEIWLIWDLKGRIEPFLLGISSKIFTDLNSATKRLKLLKRK